MTALTFMIKKNMLCEKHLSITLIPEDQLEDVPSEKLNYSIPIPLKDSTCPYCVTHKLNCNDCIMFNKNNGCMTENNTSTWDKAVKAYNRLDYGDKIKFTTEYFKLVDNYNKQFDGLEILGVNSRKKEALLNIMQNNTIAYATTSKKYVIYSQDSFYACSDALFIDYVKVDINSIEDKSWNIYKN